MSQTKVQLISDLVQALNFTGTASAPANGLFLSAANTLQLSTASTPRLTINSDGHVDVVGNLDVGAGIDVTGAITGTGDVTITKASPVLRLADTTDPQGVDGVIGKIEFFGNDGSSGGVDVRSVIQTISTNAAGNAHALTIGLGESNNAPGEKIRILGDGKVGLGTTNPDGELHISTASAGTVTANADGDELVLENSGNVGLSLLTAGTGESTIFFGNPGTNGERDAFIKHYHETHATTANRRNLVFQVSGGERMRLSSSELRLIRTTTNAKITLSRNEDVDSDNAPTGVIDFANNTAHTVNSRIQAVTDGANNVGGQLIVETRDPDNSTLSEKFRIKGNGNVGIGTTNPSALLTLNQTIPELRVQSSNNNFGMGDELGRISLYTADGSTPGAGEVFRIKTESASSIGADYTTRLRNRNGAGGGATEISLGNGEGSVYFATNTTGNATPSVRMKVGSDGNVGIGTTSPSTKLHVNGDITAANSIVSANLPGRNIIVNGAMQVAQRGTSFTNISNTGVIGSVDRIVMVGANLDELAFAGKQTSDGPDGFSNCFEFDVTTAENALDANDLAYIRYKVEGQDLVPLFNANGTGKDFTLSFYVKAYQTGTYQLNIYKNQGPRFISKTYTIASSGVWQRIELNFTGDTNTSGMNDDNGNGFQIAWILVAGTDYTSQGVLPNWGGWPGNSGFAGGQAVNVASSTNNYFRITGIQLEVGSKATAFEHRRFADELRRCQRYFYMHASGSVDGNGTGGSAICDNASAYNSDLVFFTIDLPVTMRTKPSLVVSNGTNDYGYYVNGSALLGFSTLSLDGVTTRTVGNINFSVSSGFSGGQSVLVRTKNSSATLAFSAEL